MDSEKDICGRLREPAKGKPEIEKIIKHDKEIIWIGREFAPHGGKRADFAGVDKNGYIISIEVKTGESDIVACQVAFRTLSYFKALKSGHLNESIKHYVAAKIKSKKADVYFMGPLLQWWDNYKNEFRNGVRSMAPEKVISEEEINGLGFPTPINGLINIIIGPTLPVSLQKIITVVVDDSDIVNPGLDMPLCKFIEYPTS